MATSDECIVQQDSSPEHSAQYTLCLKKRDPDVIDCNFEKY